MQKKPSLFQIEQGDCGTRGRDRTGTILLSLVFETNASTNSATRALFVFWSLPFGVQM